MTKLDEDKIIIRYRLIQLGIDKIIRDAAVFFQQDYGLIMGKCRKRTLFKVRMFICYFVHRDFDMCSSVALGKILGGRDHATILNAVSKMSDGLEIYADVREHYDRFRRYILDPKDDLIEVLPASSQKDEKPASIKSQKTKPLQQKKPKGINFGYGYNDFLRDDRPNKNNDYYLDRKII